MPVSLDSFINYLDNTKNLVADTVCIQHTMHDPLFSLHKVCFVFYHPSLGLARFTREQDGKFLLYHFSKVP